jgi:hypothetical protein
MPASAFVVMPASAFVVMPAKAGIHDFPHGMQRKSWMAGLRQP